MLFGFGSGGGGGLGGAATTVVVYVSDVSNEMYYYPGWVWLSQVRKKMHAFGGR
jgi:hypothetical protein